MEWRQGRLSALSKREKAAIGAVARRFSAKYEQTEASSGVALSIAGKRIAVEVATFKEPAAGRADFARPRLRFDKVALRLVEHVQTALRGSVPSGITVIFTITAPIRLPAKTVGALEHTIRACLGHRPMTLERKDAVHGNEIRIRIVKCSPPHVSRVIGLVHNAETDSQMLLHTMQALLQHTGRGAGGHGPAESANERWLVVIVESGYAQIEAYRQLYTQLSMPWHFARILMVFDGSRVETLTG
jgi:hypothetical protein